MKTTLSILNIRKPLHTTIAALMLILVAATGLPAAEPTAQQVSTNVSAKQASASIVAVRGTTIVLAADNADTLSQGTQFEVYVELGNDLGSVTIAQGKIESVTGGVIIGTISSQDQKAKLSTKMQVRFKTNQAATKPVVQTVSLKPAEPKPIETKTTEAKSPATTAPAFNSLQEAITHYRKAICLVKNAKSTKHGTGFVISREHRLVVTNAHIADFAEQVVLNESRTVYKVVKRWLHPDTIRTLRYDNKTPLNSTDARLGEVNPLGTDIALLQLEMTGPELPAEVILARPDEVQDILAANIGILGFPGYDTKAQDNQFAQATFISGSISRIDRLMGFTSDQPMKDRRRVSYTAPNYGGFSGSPVILSNGKVVVVNNAIRRLKDGTKIGLGTRVDALWDMLKLLKLADKIPNAPVTLPEPINIKLQNPKAIKMLKAVAKLRAAIDHRANKEYGKAIELLDEIIVSVPDYWEPYNVAAKVIDDMLDSTTLTDEQRVKLSEASAKNFIKAEQLHYESFNYHPVSILLDIARQSINVTRYGGEQKYQQAAIKLLADAEITKIALQSKNAAYYLALRSTLLKDLGKYKEALLDIDRAIKLDPEHGPYQNERDRILRLIDPKPQTKVLSRYTFSQR